MSYINLLEIVYPIGSIIFSTTSTSPASYVGGTWVQITDGRFMRPQGTWNQTGGENAHKLLSSEMPYHYHDVCQQLDDGNWYSLYFWDSNVGSGNGWKVPAMGGGTTPKQVSTRGRGSNVAHNNVPEYRTCYCFYRTA